MLGEIAADEFEKGRDVWDKRRRLRDWGLRSGGSSVKMADALGGSETGLKL